MVARGCRIVRRHIKTISAIQPNTIKYKKISRQRRRRGERVWLWRGEKKAGGRYRGWGWGAKIRGYMGVGMYAGNHVMEWDGGKAVMRRIETK